VKNPWISYTLIRLSLFFGVFLALITLQFNTFFAAIIAATVSFAISLVFLDRQRKAMSQSVADKLARNSSGTYEDKENDLENDLMDSEAEADKKDPGADQDPKA
jgi:mannitol-specific phosphotransferase system IIBC component